MLKNVAFIVSLLLSFILAGSLIQSYRSQHATSRQLADIEKRLDRPAVTTPPTFPAAPTPLVIVENTSLPTQYADQHEKVEQVMTAGWKLINRRSPEDAKHAAELFAAALKKIDGNSPDLYNGLGRSLLISGDPSAAIQAWRKGLAIQPKLVEMQSGIGWAYWHLNDPYRAKQAWDAAIKADPKSVDAWAALAWIDLALGNIGESKMGFQVLVERDHTNRAWVMGLAMARARNSDPSQIDPFFRLPNLATFNVTTTIDPADKQNTPPASGI